MVLLQRSRIPKFSRFVLRSSPSSSSSSSSFASQMASKPISSPVPVESYPILSVLLLSIGFVLTAAFFIYEATSSKRSRSLSKEIATSAVASIFLGFGSLFLLLATGVYV